MSNGSVTAEVTAAAAAGNLDSLTDWSSGSVPGASISAAEPSAVSTTSSFETYLQSLERPEEPAETPQPSSPESTVAPEPSTAKPAEDAQPSTEQFYVTDETGRRTRVTVDYSDRAKIKQAYEQAAGMRKFQAERDAQKSALAKYQQEVAPTIETWKKFEDAWKTGGMEGVVDLIAGQQGSYRNALEKYANSTPDERIAMERQLAEEKVARAAAAKDEAVQSQLKEVQARLEAAEDKETRALVTPSFHKYRFAGQLGDPTAEHHLDSAIWAQSLDRLEKYNGDITPEVVDQVFSEVSSAFRRTAKVQTERTIKNVVAKKKEEASSQAAAAAMKGMANSNGAKTMEQRLWAGDSVGVLADLFRGMRK